MKNSTSSNCTIVKIQYAISKYLMLLVALFSFYFGFSQNKNVIDSLQIVINSIEVDSMQAKEYYEASQYMIRTHSDLDAAQIFADSILAVANRIGDKKQKAAYHFTSGMIHRFKSNYDIALKHLDSNIIYYKNDSLKTAVSLFQVAAIHHVQGDYEKSLDVNLAILRIFESQKTDYGNHAAATVYNLIGNLYGEQGKIPEAIENYEAAIELLKKINEQFDIALGYKNLGIMYFNNGDRKKGMDYIERAIKIGRELDNEYGLATFLQTSGNFNLQENNIDKALSLITEALGISKKIDFPNLIAVNYSSLGDIWEAKKDYKKAANYYLQALEIDENIKAFPKVIEIHKKLSAIYVDIGDFKKGLGHQLQYVSIKDSLFNVKNTNSINLLEKQFETQKKNNEIVNQQLQIQKQENQILKRNSQYYKLLFVALFLLISIIGLYAYYRKRQKLKNKEIEILKVKQEVTKLESLIIGEEKERKRLAQDLHDGINGDLSVIKYKITDINHNKLDDNEKSNFTLAISMLDNAIEQVRHISHNLAPPSLQNFNLIEAISQYCSKINMSTEIDLDFQNFGDPIVIEKESETAIYRIVQEAVNNIVKHSKATQALVQINNHKHTLSLIIEDNGKGFEKDAMKEGLGLKNIKSRVSILNADFVLDTSENGTTLQIDINLNNLKND